MTERSSKKADRGATGERDGKAPGKRAGLAPAARRALAEAEDRRKARASGEKDAPGEAGGRRGPDPVRYGDWEKNGIASDF